MVERTATIYLFSYSLISLIVLVRYTSGSKNECNSSLTIVSGRFSRSSISVTRYCTLTIFKLASSIACYVAACYTVLLIIVCR